VRAFTFVDQVHEVTDVFRPGADMGDVMGGLAARTAQAALWGRTDYGRAFVTFAEEYELEYGTATLEVHQDAFAPGERVLIVDDVLATGGTARATASLIHQAGAEVVGVAVLMELSFLKGREAIPDLEVRSLLVV